MMLGRKGEHVPSSLNIFFKLDPNSNKYFLAKLSVDTAENEPLKATDSAAGENTKLVVNGSQ